MDRLFKRYACPFSLVSGYIRTSRFTEFVDAFVKEVNESEKWEFYLHRVWNKSYADFERETSAAQNTATMTENEMEATVRETMRILGTFNPEKERG